MITPDYCDISCDSWLRAAGALTFKFVLTGAAWGWLYPESFWRQPSRLRQCLMAIAGATIVGTLQTLLTAMALAEAGWFQSWADGIVTLGFAAAGAVLGFVVQPDRFRRYLTAMAPGAAALFCGFALSMLLPLRGEWILGGWDPGVYINQGVHVAETGTFHPGPDEALSALTAKELPVFTRGSMRYLEAYPGMPVDPSRRAYRHYFFRLMPTLVAVQARAGGLRAATRVNLMLGPMLLILFAAFLVAHQRGGAHAAFATLLLAASPLWLYHLHIPTTEMLQLFLLCGIGVLLPYRRESRTALALLGLLSFAAVANRYDFFPFALVLLWLTACVDFTRPDRRRVWMEHSVFMMAIAAGALFDLATGSITLVRLGRVLPLMQKVAALFMGLTLATNALAGRNGVDRIRAAIPVQRLVWAALLAAGLALVAVYAWGHRLGLASVSLNLHRIVPYLGWGPLAAAGVGALLLFGPARGATPLFKAFLLFLAVASATLPVYSHMKELVYPYLTRRYLPFTVPLLAIGGGAAMAALWERGGSRKLWFKAGAVALCLAVVAGTARQSERAWRCTEYNGVSRLLAEAAAHIEPGAIVVADHHWWGTPLTFIYGKPTLSGKSFYDRGAPTMTKGMAALHRLAAEGRHVMFFTSTASGLDVYPASVGPVRLEWESPPVVLHEIIHHRAGDSFVLRDKPVVFRLYRWREADE